MPIPPAPKPPSTHPACEAHAAPARAVHFDWTALATLWTDRKVRASVFGYFGHMWELYTMWVLLPLVLATRLDGAAPSFAAFGVLGVAGALGSVGSGLLARRIGSAPVAAAWLATSGLCCLLTPWLFDAPGALFALWLVVWGFAVTGDSPQFSALTASNAPRHAMGRVLMLTNCIGFAISIVSIELHVRLASHVPLAMVLPWLAIGPLAGLWMLRGLRRAGATACRGRFLALPRAASGRTGPRWPRAPWAMPKAAVVSAFGAAAVTAPAFALNPSTEGHRVAIKAVVAERRPLAGALGLGALAAFTSTYHSLRVASYTTIDDRTVCVGAFGVVYVLQPSRGDKAR